MLKVLEFLNFNTQNRVTTIFYMQVILVLMPQKLFYNISQLCGDKVKIHLIISFFRLLHSFILKNIQRILINVKVLVNNKFKGLLTVLLIVLLGGGKFMKQLEGAIMSLINDWFLMICALSPFVGLGLFTLYAERKRQRMDK